MGNTTVQRYCGTNKQKNNVFSNLYCFIMLYYTDIRDANMAISARKSERCTNCADSQISVSHVGVIFPPSRIKKKFSKRTITSRSSTTFVFRDQTLSRITSFSHGIQTQNCLCWFTLYNQHQSAVQQRYQW